MNNAIGTETETFQGLHVGARLQSIPEFEGCSYHLLLGSDGLNGDAYLAERRSDGELRVIAFIDHDTSYGYPCSAVTEPNPRDSHVTPLVKTTGDILHGATGQLTILQKENYYRRYSRWDRVADPRHGKAVRTLPQCGCGGYLGAPMMFGSFQEMTAYFFVVFSDAEKVDEQHACVLRGE